MPTLQEFISDYIETIGGDYEEVEPEVYDVLLPEVDAATDLAPPKLSRAFQTTAPTVREFADRGVLRVAYDPEAVPEHPGSQLLCFGTPLVDAILNDAARRGRMAVAYMTGLNVQTRDIPAKIRRSVKLPDGFDWSFDSVRLLNYPQAIFWFEATFASDLKEQELLPVGFDLATMREVRRLDQLLDFKNLVQRPIQSLIEARHGDLTEVYLKARQEVIRTVSALGNIRRRELDTRLEKQVARMQLYYSDLRKELGEQERRTVGRPPKNAAKNETKNQATLVAANANKSPSGWIPADAGMTEAAAKFSKRLETINREETHRITELRQKSALKITLRLASLLLIQLPKVCVQASAVGKRGVDESQTPMELIWNPLSEQMEAATCPVCGGSTFAFRMADKKSRATSAIVCDKCAP